MEKTMSKKQRFKYVLSGSLPWKLFLYLLEIWGMLQVFYGLCMVNGGEPAAYMTRSLGAAITPVYAFASGGLCILIGLGGLLYCAGHKRGREEIQPSFLNCIYTDILCVIAGLFLLGWFWLLAELTNFYRIDVDVFFLAICVWISSVTAFVSGFFVELMIRMKLGNIFQRTLLWRLLVLVFRVLEKGFRLLGKIFWGISVYPMMILLWGAVAGCFFVSAVVFAGRLLGILAWLAGSMLLGLLMFGFAYMYHKLLKGTRAIAEGDYNTKIDTKSLIWEFKTQGQCLNTIGDGLKEALEQQLKSERMKTELITNVSHDIKTPLTSIINYSDLLGSTELEPEKVKSYSEVLLRQSKRLKKLLEDLIEASKATTGSIEVFMQKCQVGILLEQACGEYEERFQEKELEVVVAQPSEDVTILADGRLLWRVFDNLLNNIYKYGQEKSRVYISVERIDGRTVITFKNMSKYALNISSEELEERFVRGDKSRHLEGNGLGLSIAKSLLELQNGSLEIMTDGDLFKAIIGFEEAE